MQVYVLAGLNKVETLKIAGGLANHRKVSGNV